MNTIESIIEEEKLLKRYFKEGSINTEEYNRTKKIFRKILKMQVMINNLSCNI